MIQKKIIAFFGIALLLSCEKNTVQLPDPVNTPAELVVPARINGLATVDFIFHQTKSSDHDTVWLSLRNISGRDISALQYVAELCNAVPQLYSNCNLQITGTLKDVLKAGETRERIYSWIDKKIMLDSSLINTGIVSYAGMSQPVAGVCSSVYAIFETAEKKVGYYGSVRGYVLADGTATFRLKGKNEEEFNVSGHFTQTLSFDGLLSKGSQLISPFTLDSLDTGNEKLTYRLQLDTPLSDSIHSILVITQRN